MEDFFLSFSPFLIFKFKKKKIYSERQSDIQGKRETAREQACACFHLLATPYMATMASQAWASWSLEPELHLGPPLWVTEFQVLESSSMNFQASEQEAGLEMEWPGLE